MLPQSRRTWACPDCAADSAPPAAASMKRSAASDDEEDRLARKKKAKPSTIPELADLISESYKDVAEALSRVAQLTEELTNLKAVVSTQQMEIRALTESNEHLQSYNMELRERVDELEQYSRKSNCIVRGVPEAGSEREEDTTQRMAALLAATGLPDPVKEISACHRLPKGKRDQHRPIIIKFTRRITKTEFIKKAKAVKLSTSYLPDQRSQAPQPIYVEEHLTQSRSRLAAEARSLRFDGLVAHAWVREGCVYVRRHEGERALRVPSSEWLTEYRATLLSERQSSLLHPGSRQAGRQAERPAPAADLRAGSASAPVSRGGVMECDVTVEGGGSVFPRAAPPAGQCSSPAAAQGN